MPMLFKFTMFSRSDRNPSKNFQILNSLNFCYCHQSHEYPLASRHKLSALVAALFDNATSQKLNIVSGILKELNLKDKIIRPVVLITID